MKEYIDIRRIKRLWPTCLFAVILCACSAEPDEVIPPATSPGKAIEFIFTFPDGEQDLETRAKTQFNTNDKAYITAEVTLIGGSTIVESMILRYNGNTWVGDGFVPIWPENTLKATFTAYLFPQISNDFGVTFTTPTLEMTNDFNLAIPLSSFKEKSKRSGTSATDDPFMARVTDIPVNGIVPLQFAHMTTKLIVTGLKHGITDKVRFYNADPVCQIDNQIVFKYSATEGFTHEFTYDESKTYIEQEIEVTGSSGSESSRVTFFLHVDSTHWKEYPEFRLAQITESGNYGTIEEPVTEKTTSLAEKTALRTMRRGRAYSMYFLDSQTNHPFLEEEKWYVESSGTKVFTSKEEIQDYFTQTLSNGYLTEDLDFNFIDIEEGLILRSSLLSKAIEITKSLNGNHRTIRNISVKNGLFNEIPSGMTIQNLRLENVKVESSGTNKAGLLAPVNNGTIKNVRISGNNSMGTDNVSCVGGMVGINNGIITDSQIEGALIMDCYGALSVGGFVGDNDGKITGSEVISAAIARVANTEGEVSVGGFVGVNDSEITTSSSNMLVDATHVNAANSHTGGFAGENTGSLVSCEATGDVKGGNASGRVTVGGFVGYIPSTAKKVNKCYATGYVYEHKESSGGTNVQIGGFGGFSQISLTNCSSTGKLSLTHSNTVRDVGALMGLHDATKYIYNSFSVSTTSDNKPLGFGGEQDIKVENCHYTGFMLNPENGKPSAEKATAALLNSGRGGYSEWTSNSSYFNGAPYLIK
ncbi:fimbrillin family protein [Parabacteroides sp. OttesenSCG-928-G07]|nr:fimbrillin family protein [Parabacteroides sp. OttesenSCG-928-G07]